MKNSLKTKQNHAYGILGEFVFTDDFEFSVEEGDIEIELYVELNRSNALVTIKSTDPKESIARMLEDEDLPNFMRSVFKHKHFEPFIRDLNVPDDIQGGFDFEILRKRNYRFNTLQLEVFSKSNRRFDDGDEKHDSLLFEIL